MSDDDLELEQDSSEIDELPEASTGSRDGNYWEKQARKFKEEAVKRKVENGRLRIAAKHGIDPDSIPEYVPLSGLDDFVTKFLVKPEDSTVPTQTEAPTEAEADPIEQVVSEAERNLAAVTQGSVSPGGSAGMDEDEVRRLARTDPARYAALRASGSIPPPSRIGADKNR